MQPAPDPTRYRSTLTWLSLGQVVSWAVLYYGFSSFVLPMQREMGWSGPQVMSAFSLGLLAWGAGSYAVGAAIDRGRSRQVMSGGAVLAGVGLLVWSQAHSVWMLQAAWLLIGAAMAATLYEAAFTTVTRRFPTRFAAAITTLTLVGGLASTLSFPTLALLIPALGWRNALVLLALVMGVGVATANAWALRATAPAVAAPGAAPAAAMPGARLAQALRAPVFWWFALCFAAQAVVIASFWAHAMPAFAAKGWSEAQAVTVLAWVGPAQVAGRVLYVWLGRRLSPRGIGLVVIGGLPVAMLVFALAQGLLPLIGFAVVYGFANGMATIVRGTTIPVVFGHLEVARISGALAAIAVFGRAAAPLLSAWMLLVLGSYSRLGLGMTGLAVLALAAYAIAWRGAKDVCRA